MHLSQSPVLSVTDSVYFLSHTYRDLPSFINFLSLFLFKNLFYFKKLWLCWVSVAARQLSLVALCGLILLWSTGSRGGVPSPYQPVAVHGGLGTSCTAGGELWGR